MLAITEYQLLGAVVRNVRRQPVDPQGSILDAAMRDRAVARRSRQSLQSIGEARLAVRQTCFGSSGTACFALACAEIIGTNTCFRSP
ncbi:UNVERIFIED_ORG: hypothetical protein M2435_006060 [Rhizobium sophorae]|nr:hypothetical protein [Rhizobium sophorae]